MITIPFFLFLAVTAVLYWIARTPLLRNGILSLSSLTFITLQDYRAMLVVLGLTLPVWLAGKLIYQGRRPELVHSLAVTGVVLLLVLFKYLGLLAETINSAASFFSSLPLVRFEQILLPLGISYITFKYISYLTDIRWKITPPGSFLELLTYGSLFTIFVAGPIERFERLRPQLTTLTGFSFTFLEEGFERIVFGLFKKLVLADWIGYFIMPVWESPDSYSLAIRALALAGFSLQIYFDFSGYSDLAIGSSRLFGLKIMENFNWPYLQPNISQFWRSWHISLSDWIRDYLFFPLSNLSRNKFWLTFAVPVIAMGICGLWHGGAWHFLLWGVWHGAGLALFQVWQNHKRKHPGLAKLAGQPWFNLVSVLITFLFVTTGWLLFI